MLNLLNKKTKNTFTLFPSALSTPKSDYISKNVISTNKDIEVTLNEKIGEARHFPSAVNEWTNSIYSFNKSIIKTLPATDNMVNRLIKSYFSLSPLINKKKSKRVQIRFRRLSLNRILVSKAEMKHTNNKVIVTVYLYNKNKKFLIYKLKNLYKTFVLKLSGSSAIKNKENVAKTVKLASQQKNKHITSGLKNNKTYKALATSNKTSYINFKSNDNRSTKNVSRKPGPVRGFHLIKEYVDTKINHTTNKKSSNKKTFTTKRKPIFNKGSEKAMLVKPIYNYVNFSDLTKKRLKKFLSIIKNVSVKNKYKTLITNHYSILSKYKLYPSKDFLLNTEVREEDLAPNINSNLNTVNMPNSINFALNNNIYTSAFYELLKINNQGSLAIKKQINGKSLTFAFKTKRRNITPMANILPGNFVSPIHLNKKGTRKLKNLMYKLRNFYKLFTLDSMYNYKPNTGIVANNILDTAGIATGLSSKNSFYSYITKILKKNIVTNAKSLAMKKINLITLKSVRIIKRARKNKNFLIKTLNWSAKNFLKYESKYYKRFIRKAYKKEMLYLYYIRMLSLNNNKFKNWFLSGLKRVLSTIYNKKVEFNLVSLKYLHLNSDIFTESIAVKLRNRQNRLLTVLKKALTLVKLPSNKGSTPLYIGSELSPGTIVHRNKFNGLNLNAFSTMLSKNNDALHNILLNIFTNNLDYSSQSSKLYKTPNYIGTSAIQQKDVLDAIKYKSVSGVRLEAAGRLSRRLTASRSVFKLKYKGSLKNMDSSYRGISSVILKGNTKSNIQYTLISSKTRNGAFGLKGWVSGY